MKHLNLLKRNLIGLEDSIYAESLQKDPMTERTMLKANGSYILQIFARGSENGDGITAKDMKRISMVTRLAIAVLTHGSGDGQTGGQYLDKLQSMLTAMFKPQPEEL